MNDNNINSSNNNNNNNNNNNTIINNRIIKSMSDSKSGSSKNDLSTSQILINSNTNNSNSNNNSFSRDRTPTTKRTTSITAITTTKSLQQQLKLAKLSTESTSILATATATTTSTKAGTTTAVLSNPTSRSSLSSSSKVKTLQSGSKDEKIRESVFEDPRYRAKQLKKQRRQDIQKRFNEPLQHAQHKSNTKTSKNDDSDSSKANKCHMTFIFDPNGRFSYWMGFIVSLAFLYNFWVMIYRYSFNEINSKNKFYWFAFDYFADFLYICDILFNFRTGFLEEGVLQTDPVRLRHHYMNTTRFYVDCLCLMPLDILYLSIGYYSIFRCFRLVKIYRFWAFLDRTERHTNFPNVFRTVVMLHYLFAIFHWNACFSYLLSRYLSGDLMFKNQFSSYHSHVITSLSKPDDRFKYKTIESNELFKEYLKAFYLSTKVMTLVSEMPNPKSSEDYLFAIFQLIVALLLFATIMGHVGYIVSNLGNARKEFQSKLDAVKTYMSLRRVPKRLQDRVIRWFDFLWTNHKSTDDNQILNLLPYKLRAEIAIHVHLDTLKRVEIFQNTEAGFLNELVLRLKPVLYSPGDFICRKGEVGKEMYIVNGGKLQVISDNGKIVLATLKAGSYFGEISILNMGASGNRRTASVKSVGYSDLFCLSKEDLWEVLKEYPAVRVKLEAIAVKRLEKHKKPLIELVHMNRCKSAPGLMHASMANTPVPKGLKRYGTLPASLLKRTDISVILSNNTSSSKSNKNKNDKSKNQLKPNSLSNNNNINKSNSSTNIVNNNNNNNNNKNALVDSKPQIIRIVSEEPATQNNKANLSLFNSFNNEKLNQLVLPSSKSSSPIALNYSNNNNNNNNNNTNPHSSSFSVSSQLYIRQIGASNLISNVQNSPYCEVKTENSKPFIDQHNNKSLINSNSELVLVQEIDKLKQCIEYLKTENASLNLKLEKLTWNSAKTQIDEIKIEMETSKLNDNNKIFSDEYKV